jgi:hypothetical protein
MFETLESRQFLSVTPTGDAPPATDMPPGPVMDADAVANKKKPKATTSPNAQNYYGKDQYLVFTMSDALVTSVSPGSVSGPV